LAVVLAFTRSGVVPGVGVHPHAGTRFVHDFRSWQVFVFLLVGRVGELWQEFELVVHDFSVDWASGSTNGIDSRFDESINVLGATDLGSVFKKWFSLEDPVFERVVLDPLVAPWHEWVFSHDFFVVFIAASEPEETVFPGWFSKWAVVSTIFDHFDVISTGPPFVVKGRDVEVVGVTFAFGTSELVGDNWFEQLWVVQVQSLGSVSDGSFFVALRDTVLAGVFGGVAVPASTHDSSAVEFGDTWEANILPQVDEFGKFLSGDRSIRSRDVPDVVGATKSDFLQFQIVNGGVVHEWVQVEAVPEEPGAVLRSFELIGFLDPEFVLVVEDKEDVIVAPWDFFDLVLGHISSTEVWVVAAVWVDFALVSGDVSAEVFATWLPLFWLDQSTGVEVHHLEVDEVKFLAGVSTRRKIWDVWLGNSGEAAWVDLSGGGHDEHFLHLFWAGFTLASQEERSGHWVDVAVFDHRVDVELFGVFNSEHKRHGFDRHFAAFGHPLDEGEFLVGGLFGFAFVS